jgi:glycosyltransferase involved in cell wall biosynthesis
MDNMKVLFLLPYPTGRAPSQRFRVEQLLPLLDNAGINYTLQPFISRATWNVLYNGGATFKKIIGVLNGYVKRVVVVLFEAKKYDYIFIHREAAPIGPPIIEWYLAKILKKNIIYDFDDAIWIPNTSTQNMIANAFKAFWKVAYICKWSKSILAGNNYLCEFARNNSQANIVRMPTVVDTVNRYNVLKQHHNDKIVIGWTGSHSTLKYLDLIIPVLQKLQQEVDFTFLVIADKKPELSLNNVEFLPWNAATEIQDLLHIDIGVMPLVQDLWSEGKCGFKLIQYLALGIPAVADPVGVNKEIVENGINGYLCITQVEWFESLKKLIIDRDLRRRCGQNGRDKIIKSYSITSNADAFLSVFK